MSVSTCQEVFPECVGRILEIGFLTAGSEATDSFSLDDSFLGGNGVA